MSGKARMKVQEPIAAETAVKSINSLLHHGIRIIVMLCLTSSLWLGTPALGVPVFVETFDGAALDPGLWDSGGVSVSQGRARIDSLPGQPIGGRGAFWSKFGLVGDFDVRVDIAFDPWPYNNGLHMGFEIRSANDSGESAWASVERFSDYGRESEVARVPYPVIHQERPVANTSGTWRLTRSGDYFCAYTWDGVDNWILLGSASMTATLPLGITIGAWSDRVSSSQAGMMFDNLTVVTGTIVPEPSAVALLGLGTLVWHSRRKMNLAKR
jgi:hypothetical protein